MSWSCILPAEIDQSVLWHLLVRGSARWSPGCKPVWWGAARVHMEAPVVIRLPPRAHSCVHLGMCVQGFLSLPFNHLGIRNGFWNGFWRALPKGVCCVHCSPALKKVVSLLYPVSSNSRANRRGDRCCSRLRQTTNSCMVNYGSLPLFKISALGIKDKKFFRVIRDCRALMVIMKENTLTDLQQEEAGRVTMQVGEE